MRKIIHAAAALALATAAVTALGATGAQAADGSWDGCPYGAVCVYGEGAPTSTPPTDVFWSYGAHNLQNKTGWHWVLNNQSGGAHAHLCLGYNGTNCNYDMPAQNGVWADLTPVNSITLDRP
ncbi:hypothetical protein [Streptomyces sp. CB01881]|uniref:hypothetical protein n=1 Tax=Streptomyces sp. CB01881 TaxID=2078691 RepID=UPI000CDC388C|nr:hypothetical protein [Streptomyces sp. CB01881]AUY48033.1 hypothetical protein C2142_02540 [Streptomyces sp. CB01881]TYC76513.1 hypothetical protein EH183_02550 [Streptomyces sp. CB01881]